MPPFSKIGNLCPISYSLVHMQMNIPNLINKRKIKKLAKRKLTSRMTLNFLQLSGDLLRRAAANIDVPLNQNCNSLCDQYTPDSMKTHHIPVLRGNAVGCAGHLIVIDARRASDQCNLTTTVTFIICLKYEKPNVIHRSNVLSLALDKT